MEPLVEMTVLSYQCRTRFRIQTLLRPVDRQIESMANTFSQTETVGICEGGSIVISLVSASILVTHI